MVSSHVIILIFRKLMFGTIHHLEWIISLCVGWNEQKTKLNWENKSELHMWTFIFTGKWVAVLLTNKNIKIVVLHSSLYIHV